MQANTSTYATYSNHACNDRWRNGTPQRELAPPTLAPAVRSPTHHHVPPAPTTRSTTTLLRILARATNHCQNVTLLAAPGGSCSCFFIPSRKEQRAATRLCTAAACVVRCGCLPVASGGDSSDSWRREVRPALPLSLLSLSRLSPPKRPGYGAADSATAGVARRGNTRNSQPCVRCCGSGVVCGVCIGALEFFGDTTPPSLGDPSGRPLSYAPRLSTSHTHSHTTMHAAASPAIAGRKCSCAGAPVPASSRCAAPPRPTPTGPHLHSLTAAQCFGAHVRGLPSRRRGCTAARHPLQAPPTHRPARSCRRCGARGAPRGAGRGAPARGRRLRPGTRTFCCAPTWL